MQRDTRSAEQEVEITSEALASLFAAAAAAPGDVEALLFGRLRRPAVRKEWSDGDASSSAAATERPCMVVEGFDLIGRLGDNETIQGKTREAVFSSQIRERINRRCSTSGGQKVVGFCTMTAAPGDTLLQRSMPRLASGRFLKLMFLVRKEMTEMKAEGIQPIACLFQRDTEVGDLGAFASTSICVLLAKSSTGGMLPRVHMKVGSMGQTAEAEPAMSRLPPHNAELRDIFNQSEELRRAITKQLESSVEESLKRLNHEQLDLLGARLHEEARIADETEPIEKAVQTPLAAELEPLAERVATVAPKVPQAEGTKVIEALKQKRVDLQNATGPPSKARRVAKS